MSYFARGFFVLLHIMQIIAIVMLFKEYHFVDPALYEAVKDQKSVDAMHVASQLGRFDMVSLILSMIGIFISLAAIFAFIEVRSRSVRVAAETAEREAARVAQEVAELQIRPEASRIIEEFFDRKGIDLNKLPTKSGTMSQDAGGDIASALEGKTQ